MSRHKIRKFCPYLWVEASGPQRTVPLSYPSFYTRVEMEKHQSYNSILWILNPISLVAVHWDSMWSTGSWSIGYFNPSLWHHTIGGDRGYPSRETQTEDTLDCLKPILRSLFLSIPRYFREFSSSCQEHFIIVIYFLLFTILICVLILYWFDKKYWHIYVLCISFDHLHHSRNAYPTLHHTIVTYVSSKYILNNHLFNSSAPQLQTHHLIPI